MVESWLSVLPICIVICATVISGQLNSALLIGICTAALIATHGSITAAFQLCITQFFNQLYTADTFYLYAFLIILPSLIDLFIKTGSAAAFAHTITKKIKTKRSIEYASIITSCALSIDDYLSILTTGHVLKTLTDRVGIARAKLAYLIHSLSGNLVILIPISSWVGPLTTYLKISGVGQGELINTDPFTLYLASLPFVMYSVLTIFTVLLIVSMKLSFGPMHTEEAKNNIQSVFQNADALRIKGNSAHLFGPIVLLFVLIFTTILYKGDCILFGGNHSILEAFTHNSNIFFVLAFASSCTFSITALYFVRHALISFYDIIRAVLNSAKLMQSVLVMIFLMALFSSLLRNELGTGMYLAKLTAGHMHTLFIPLIFFCVAFLIAFCTGTSWGTFGLLLPIGIPMVANSMHISEPTSAQHIPLLLHTIGAILSGALCGDHLSLYSETTGMSAATTQITPLQHFKTQLPYGVPAIVGSLIFFLISGYCYQLPLWQSYTMATGAALISCFICLLFCVKYCMNTSLLQK